MNKEKRKQIILIVLAFVFMGIGWFNFSNNNSVPVAAEDSRNELNLGDVQLVNSEVSNEEKEEYLSEIVPNEDIDEASNQGADDTESLNTTNLNTMLETNNDTSKNEYFVETKLERDTMYSEMLGTYQKMLENPEVGESQKAIATQEITNITNTKNGIMISENLIKNKGFKNVVILVNNGVASVIVEASLLNQEEIAKIQNIVSRELNIEIKNINISKK